MDPQATISLIADCIKDNDFDGFHQAFNNLYRWLRRGGFAPVVTPETFGRNIVIARFPCRTIHIQTIVADSLVEMDSKFEFVVYDDCGSRIESFKLG